MGIIQPSLRDLGNPKSTFPTLKRWAILGHPSGMKRHKTKVVLPGVDRNRRIAV